MASVQEMEAYCRNWLVERRGKLRLQRDLYLVTGLSDETSGCWYGQGGMAQSWGAAVFSNWHPADLRARASSPDTWKRATVRVLSFPSPPYAPTLDTFVDFGREVRRAIAEHHPAKTDSGMGTYDIVCHSMGGLDVFAALLDLDVPADDKPPSDRIANAFNMATLDTPWRGVPNMDIRRKAESDAGRLRQCDALTPGSPQLALVTERADELRTRVMRLTCYGVDSAAQVEVASANLYDDKTKYDVARAKTDYRFILIPGSSHSGALGITTSVITIANLFDTLTRGDRLSVSA